MKNWLLIFSAAVLFDAALLVWCLAPQDGTEVEFFSVGEGDSELISLPGGVRILVDGGRGGNLLPELGRALGPVEKRIDLMILTHCQLDHLGGLEEAVKRFNVSAFIYNGCDSHLGEWNQLKNELVRNNIPIIQLGAGDRINYKDGSISILSPDFTANSVPDENERAITFLLKSGSSNFLFMSDAPPDLEQGIIKNLPDQIDVLKVSHHGSRFSSTPEFLDKIKPRISVIEVGKNSYGHPAASTLEKLEVYGKVYRTDLFGTIRIISERDKLNVFAIDTP